MYYTYIVNLLHLLHPTTPQKIIYTLRAPRTLNQICRRVLFYFCAFLLYKNKQKRTKTHKNAQERTRNRTVRCISFVRSCHSHRIARCIRIV